MYHRLSEQPEKWKMRLLKEQLLRCLTVSMNSYVRSTVYSKELQSYEVKQQEHQLFINHWVHQMKTPVSVMQHGARNGRRAFNSKV